MAEHLPANAQRCPAKNKSTATIPNSFTFSLLCPNPPRHRSPLTPYPKFGPRICPPAALFLIPSHKAPLPAQQDYTQTRAQIASPTMSVSHARNRSMSIAMAIPDHEQSRNRVEWLAALDTESRPGKNYRRTSIICTIGRCGLLCGS